VCVPLYDTFDGKLEVAATFASFSQRVSLLYSQLWSFFLCPQ